MRTSQRRHNDEKKLKKRLRVCNDYSRFRGKLVEVPQRAINRMKNGHRTGWRYHSCRCPWCKASKTREKNPKYISDWELYE